MNLGYSSYTAGVPGLGAALALRIGGGGAPAHPRPPGRAQPRHGADALDPREPAPGAGRDARATEPRIRLADRFAPWLGWLLRPLPELVTAPSSTARGLGAPLGVEVGIVAGEFDGKASLAETELPGAERVVVPASHTFLMARPDVQRLVLRFLSEGSFTGSPVHDGPPPDRGGGPAAGPEALAQPAAVGSSRARVDQ